MYCTIEDIIADITEVQLIRLTNDFDDANSVDKGLAEKKITEVSSYIDGAIRQHYTVPITNEDDLRFLKPLCVDLVVCALYQRRFPLDYSDALANRRKAAISEIDKIQKGTTQLVSGTPDSKPGYFRVSSRVRIFDDDMMERY
jgi:phage gp36-like protein